MKTGTITQVVKPYHKLHGRAVVVESVADGFVTVQMLEQQSWPIDQRMVCMLHGGYFTQLSDDRQQQIANTMGLRLEALPYGAPEFQTEAVGQTLGDAWDAFFAN